MSDTRFNIVFNAMSLRPGGGLTVLLGLMNGLSNASKEQYRMSVVCSADDTRSAIEEQGVADHIESICRNQGIVVRQLWTSLTMSRLVRRLKADAFLSVNQYVPRIDVPQVVYHLNLLRFMPIDPETAFLHRIAEMFRNRGSMLALKHATANVFESDYLRQCARKLSKENEASDSVIPIGLPDQWASAVKLAQPEFQANKIVSITNANDHKDSKTLIRLVAELQRLRPDVDWQLVIIGGANPERWLPFKHLAESLGVREKIQWLGFVSQDEITEHLKEALCLVSTSLVESFCMVAIEAMARGCPPVVSDCTSMPESVGSAGILADPGNPASFAQAVIKIHDDSNLRADLVTKGFQRIDQFSWTHCGQAFHELLAKLPVSPVA